MRTHTHTHTHTNFTNTTLLTGTNAPVIAANRLPNSCSDPITPEANPVGDYTMTVNVCTVLPKRNVTLAQVLAHTPVL